MAAPNPLAKMFDFVSQNAHWLTGSYVIDKLIIILLLTHHSYIWYIIPVYVVIVMWKEFWYDQKHETPEVRGSSLKDAIFYLVGLFGELGICALLIKILS